MKIHSRTIPGSRRLERRSADISKEAERRVKWFDYYEAHDRNARLTCRYFGISPQTFYRWKRRYEPRRLNSLESRSSRPHHLRQPTWTEELSHTVLRLREENPRWGKEKLADLLKDKGYKLSVSMVGRILTKLKRQGMLVEPMVTHVSSSKRWRKRPYAMRKPKDHVIQQAGDLVEVDTLDIRPLPGIVLKHFTAHDVVSKWNVIDIFAKATANNAAHFLDMLQQRSPFPVKAIQVDGGSEFEAVFEEKCRQRGIQLFVLPPRSPKLNGGVERAHRTHTEEFYEITDSDFTIEDLRPKLLRWELRYNTVRPHQSLKYQTPKEFLDQSTIKMEGMCH